MSTSRVHHCFHMDRYTRKTTGICVAKRTWNLVTTNMMFSANDTRCLRWQHMFHSGSCLPVWQFFLLTCFPRVSCNQGLYSCRIWFSRHWCRELEKKYPMCVQGHCCWWQQPAGKAKGDGLPDNFFWLGFLHSEHAVFSREELLQPSQGCPPRCTKRKHGAFERVLDVGDNTVGLSRTRDFSLKEAQGNVSATRSEVSWDPAEIRSISEATMSRVIIVCTNIHLPQIVCISVEIIKQNLAFPGRK